MSLKLGDIGLLLDAIGVYMLLVYVGVWKQLVKSDSFIFRWLFDPNSVHLAIIALAFLWFGFVFQILAAFLHR